jgi:hypothetical protein
MLLLWFVPSELGDAVVVWFPVRVGVTVVVVVVEWFSINMGAHTLSTQTQHQHQ